MQSERNREIRNARARIRSAVRRAGIELGRARGTIVAVRERTGLTDLCEEIVAVDRAIMQIERFAVLRMIEQEANRHYQKTGKRIDAGATLDSIAEDKATSVQP
jgi:hypothetical protein